MSIKYGIIYMDDINRFDESYGYLNIMTKLANLIGFETGNAEGLYSGNKNAYPNTLLMFPGKKYGLIINGWNSHFGYISKKGYYLASLKDYSANDYCDKTLSSSIAGQWTDPYSVHYRTGDKDLYNNGAKIPYCRYAINSKGDWILSFTIPDNYNNNRYNCAGGSAYYIGTKLDGADVIIDQSGAVWDNASYDTQTGYTRISRINPVYYSTQQTSQIALTDFLVRNNAYDVKSLDNIKLALTYKGSLNPYLIKDNEGNEYCVIPASCPSESALVLKEPKE